MFLKEIIPKKHRFFIWTIAIILFIGIGLSAYIYIVGIEMGNEPFTVYATVDSQKEKINITSEPEEAKIFLDGENTGKETNAVLRLKKGSYTIKLVKKGYKDYVEKTDVREGIPQKISVVLEEGEGEVGYNTKWEVYNNDSYGYLIKHPSNWNKYDRGILNKQTNNYDDPKKVVFFQEESFKGPYYSEGWSLTNFEIEAVKSDDFQSVKNEMEDWENVKKEKTKINGTKAYKYITQTPDSDGIFTTYILFINPDNPIRIRYPNKDSSGSCKSEYNRMLSTFKFKY